MTKRKINSKSNCLKLCALLLFPSALFGGLTLSGVALNEKASVIAEGYAESFSDNVEVENPSFAKGNRPYASGSTLSGWSPIEKESKATGMLIDVGSGEFVDGDGNKTTETFAKYKDTYLLDENPECRDSKDTRILMINSKANSSQDHITATKGYRSSSITLEPNAYYSFKVSAKTMLNGDDYAKASVYISGLKNIDGKEMLIGIENVSPTSWTDYYIFVATGNQSQTVTLDLYLGSARGEKSQGAVFFDDCNVQRYSENLFYKQAQYHGYSFVDNADSFTNNKVFLVEGLKTIANYIDNHDQYNFDFEDDSAVGGLGTLSEISKANGHALIMSTSNTQPTTFKNTTGFDFPGNDFSYDNDNALVMWTGTKSGYSTSYVGVKSQDIKIEAHTAYKVSLKMKIAGREEGSFTLKVTENESIYSLYPSVFSKDEDAKNYFPLQSEKTSGFTEDTNNEWTNNFQTIEFYIKGYDLYNSSVNLEFWLGDQTTNSKGCVIIDNIEVTKVATSQFSNATNKLELKAYSGTPAGFTNPLFNNTGHSGEDLAYPLIATGWETQLENETYNESGVIYLGKDDEYKTMYANKYDWAGISPARKGELTNNVYMMFNRQNSWQTLKSSTYSLSSDSYYKVSFDYYNQLFSTLNPSEIKVEIIDENGITLFSQNGVSSLNSWDTMEIYLHTARTVSHKVKVAIHFGEKDKKVGGFVYLDNFKIDASTENAYLAGTHRADLSDYFLNLGTNAFDFAVNEIFDKGYQGSLAGAEGEIVDGQINAYGITSDKADFLAISSRIASSSSFTSKFKFAFDANNYYKLTFDLATMFADGEATDEHECNYGVSIKMEGFDAIENLSTDGKLKSYTLFLKCNTTTTDAKLIFTLISDCENSLGTALLTNFNVEKSTNDEFVLASTLNTFNETTFTATQSDEKPQKPEDDKDTAKEANDNAWLLIPSIIMGVALLIGIIGILLKKVKIKKIKKVKKETYDRKLSLNHDVIASEARKRRDKEVEDLQQAKTLLAEDRARLDEEHKAFVKESRERSNGKLTREIEKAFKKYNFNIARIDEKINIIKEKINNVMTAEYLLEIQHKIASEEEAKINASKKTKK